MTPQTVSRTPPAIADPNNPTNVQVPNFTNAQAVTASATTTYSPLLLGLVASVSGFANIILQNASVGIVVKLAKGVPLIGMKILQVRSTGTTASGIKGLT